MIRHLAAVVEIVEDVPAAAAFYRDTLGLEVEGDGPRYAVVRLAGLSRFALWDQRAAAASLYGDAGQADRVPTGFCLVLEVDDVPDAVAQLREQGVDLLQRARQEPWGQTTARLVSLSGSLIELCETPWSRRLADPAP